MSRLLLYELVYVCLNEGFRWQKRTISTDSERYSVGISNTCGQANLNLYLQQAMAGRLRVPAVNKE